MDPAVRQAQRIQAGIEATQDAVNPGWLLQLNTNNTVGSVNIHDGYTHYSSEAATDNGLVLTQDRRIYQALMNSGLYSSSTQPNVGTYMKAALALNPVSYWRLGETGSNRVAVDLVGNQSVNLMPNSGMESSSPAWGGFSWFGSTVAQSSQEVHSGDYSLAISTPVSPPHTGTTGTSTPFTPVSGVTYSIGLWIFVPTTGAYSVAVQDSGSNWQRSSGSLNLTGGVWSWVTVPAFSPTTANQLYITITGSSTLISGSTIYLDDVVLVYGSIAPTSYFPGGSGNDTPPNLIPNPEAEADTGGWIPANSVISVSAAQAFSGSQSFAVTATSTSDAWLETDPAAKIPIQAGQVYTFSAYERSAATARSVRIEIDWYDVGGALVSFVLSPVVGDSTTGWTRYAATGVAPSNAVTARVFVHISSPVANEVHYIDALMLTATSGAVSYYRGNGGNDGDYIGSFAPNLLTNPSFESGVGAPWAYVNVTSAQATTPTPQSGSKVLSATATSTAMSARQNVPVTPNQWYTVSTYVQAAATARQIGGQPAITWKDSTGTQIGSTVGFAGTGSDAVGSWTRFSATAQAPSNAASADVYALYVNGTAVGEVHYADAVQFTATPNVVSYSDTRGVTLGQAGAVSGGGDTGTAVLFDGQSGYVRASRPPISAAVSVAVWFKPNGSPSNGWIIDSHTGSVGFILRFSGSTPNFWVNGIAAVSPSAVAQSQWAHLVGTYDGATSVLYVNGAAVASAAVSGTLTGSAIVNVMGGSGGTFVPGTLEEGLLYNYALSPAQVSTLYALR